MDDAGKKLLALSSDWLAGVIVELLAAFMRAGTIALLERWCAKKEEAPGPQERAARRIKENAAADEPIVAKSALQPVAASVDEDPEIDSFYTRRLEPV